MAKGPLHAIAAVLLLILVSPISGRAQEWKEPLSTRGVNPTVVYGGSVFSDLAGGIERGETYSGNLDLQLAVDGERLFHLPGLTLFVAGLWVQGGQERELSGDAQGASNLSAPSQITLYECWFQYNLFDNRFSILGGRYDLGSEFYRLQTAGLFLNSSFGTGPEFSNSGLEGPSIFPYTSVGARLAYKPAPNVVIRASVLDGVPFDRPDGSTGAFERGDGLLLVAEAAILNRAARGEPRGRVRFRVGRGSGLPPYDDKVAVGVWHYTGTFDDLSHVDSDGRPVQRRGSSGVYALADATLFRSQSDPGKRVTGFVQLGLGDERVDRFGSYVGAGLVGTGLVPTRSTDELGLAVAMARNGSHYIDQRVSLGLGTTRSETAVEVTYLAQLARWLAVQPDLQYVLHPNTDPAVPNALALQVRFEVTF